MHIKDELPFGNKTHRVAVWKGPQFGFDRVQLIAVASAGRCEQAAEEPSAPPALPARPDPGRGHAQASLETQPGDRGDGTVGRTACLWRPLGYFISQRAVFSISRAGEGPGGSEMPQKVLEDSESWWGHHGTRWHYTLPERAPLVTLSPRCCCTLPGPWFLPRSQHHHHVRRENCCYSKTANASGPSSSSPVFQPGRGCLYHFLYADLPCTCPECSPLKGWCALAASSRQVGAEVQQGFHQGLCKAWPGFYPSQVPKPASMSPSWQLHLRLGVSVFLDRMPTWTRRCAAVVLLPVTGGPGAMRCFTAAPPDDFTPDRDCFLLCRFLGCSLPWLNSS